MQRFGLRRYASRVASCAHASSSRSVATSSVLLQTWAIQTHRPWMCTKTECRKVNYARAQQCEGCGSDKPVLTRWLCVECNTPNHKGVKFCKKCVAPAASSKDFWACASCLKNNRVDDLDDVSVCGFCQYDMAPKNRSEEEVLRIQQELSQRIREQQMSFDSTSDGSAGGFGFDAAPDPWGQGAASPSAGSGGSLEAGQPATEAPAVKPKRFEFKPFVYQPPPMAVSKLMRPRKPAIPVPAGPPGFDWMCRERACGAINKGDTNICAQCQTQIIPAEWECATCGAKNHWSRGGCFSCATAITPSWLCNRCRTRTSIYDAGCRSCGSLRPPVDPVDPKDVKSGKIHRVKPSKKSGTDWVCEGCKAQNFSWRDRCFSCDMAKDPGAGGSMWTDGSGNDGSPIAAVNDNNWICDGCHASNFRTRTECWQCGKGAVAAAIASDNESVPTFAKEGFQKGVEDAPALGATKSWSNSDEWVCGKCFAKNFKSKTECHKCGTTKTVAAVTRRITVKKPVKL